MADERQSDLTAIIDLATLVLATSPPPAAWTARAFALESLARAHGVWPLVAEQLAGASADPAQSARDKAEAGRRIVLDLERESEIRRVLDALERAGVRPIVFKGAQLAYQHYARPDLRPRVDTDLLVSPESRLTAARALEGAGYHPPRHVTGDLIMSQGSFTKRRGSTIVHAVDLHWRIANPVVFADVLSYEAINRAAVAIPQLSPWARGLSGVHALFVACVHRVAHHADTDRLIWIYDIHLLATSCNGRDWAAFTELALRQQMAAVCAHSLRRSAEVFGTTVPDTALDVLDAVGAAGESSARYLAPHRSRAADLGADLRALSTWRARGRLVREHLLPSPRYMHDVYAPESRSALPVLYVKRALSGARKWLTSS